MGQVMSPPDRGTPPWSGNSAVQLLKPSGVDLADGVDQFSGRDGPGIATKSSHPRSDFG